MSTQRTDLEEEYRNTLTEIANQSALRAEAWFGMKGPNALDRSIAEDGYNKLGKDLLSSYERLEKAKKAIEDHDWKSRGT